MGPTLLPPLPAAWAAAALRLPRLHCGCEAAEGCDGGGSTGAPAAGARRFQVCL